MHNIVNLAQYRTASQSRLHQKIRGALQQPLPAETDSEAWRERVSEVAEILGVPMPVRASERQLRELWWLLVEAGFDALLMPELTRELSRVPELAAYISALAGGQERRAHDIARNIDFMALCATRRQNAA